MSSKPLKILVSGDVEGNFHQLFKRVDSIQKKSGNFDLLLCVGEFFGSDMSSWEPYKSGKAKAPISTLVLGPNRPEYDIYYSEESGDLCENVTYLGKQGRFSGSSGLQIAYLSGTEASGAADESCTFTAADAKSLISPVSGDPGYKGVDILITSQWPMGVEKYATAIDRNNPKSTDSLCIAEVARVLKPRYHFAGMEKIFYERQPYRNHQVLVDSARQATRFIGLASVGNKAKLKYLYAMTITPLKKMDPTELVKQPGDVTECPYMPSQVLAEPQAASGQQFFYDMSTKPDNGKRKGRHNQGHGDGEQREKKPRKEPVPTGPCWFCLGSPEVEKHLVVSVSDKTYVALAKGGLVPDHVLILPVHHYQSTTACPKDVLQQIDQYKCCLRDLFKSQGRSVVFFERNYRTQHLQIQAVPIPLDSVTDVKDTFISCAEAERIELAEIPKFSDITQIVPDGAPYFYVELPTKEKMLHRIGKGFSLQFGREALCEPSILNMPERVDWKSCQLERDEEKANATEFKLTFKAFDFNFL